MSEMYESNQPNMQNRTRLCARCGLLTPAAIPRCLECGALPPEMEIEQREQNRASNFVEALLERKAPFSYIFFGVNIAMFVLTMFTGGAADLDVLLSFGAFKIGLIHSGEWWRLVVPMFLHVGLIHLAVNMYALWVLGPQLEALYGSARFVMLYVLTGIGGFVASYFFSSRISVGVGASGALFGLFGVMFVFTYRYRSELPPLLQRSMKRGILWTLALNLGLTFAIPFISRSGHLGGLLTGMGLALIVPYWRLRDKKPSFGWNIGQILILLLVAASFVAMFAHYKGAKPGFRLLSVMKNISPDSKALTSLADFVEVGNAAEATFWDIQKKLESAPAGTVFPPELKNTSLKMQEKLAKVPKWDAGADALLVRLKDLLADQAAVLDHPDAESIKALRRKFNEYEDAQKQWIETAGAEYDLQFEPSDLK